ncbi:hypothetical protein BCR33DRAFT_713935 [Rhizoclosmatium globosum]|uniref:Uncharacterized protein n=1 Tax=Rhizoclosmatium globosum TaxID=329046 RepID=A0A1Y2CRJ0_9FUNG|nr:hypothetical protein BCR33DRAFT_713935 [Rhizoclosmatium globosum]|eukprot:ORY49612.1 hypothetical protein BCR33DRAFT_713935 [Rhizoclosmatium globosum]
MSAPAFAHHPHANTFTYRYGKPLIAMVLYSSLAMVSLHYVYARLDFEEQRIRVRDRMAALQTELAHWKAVKEKGEAQGRVPEAGGGMSKSQVSILGRWLGY